MPRERFKFGDVVDSLNEIIYEQMDALLTQEEAEEFIKFKVSVSAIKRELVRVLSNRVVALLADEFDEISDFGHLFDSGKVENVDS